MDTNEPIRVKPAGPLEGAAPTWQERMFGELPESIAEQGTMFDMGMYRKPARPAARVEDKAQQGFSFGGVDE